MAIRGHIVPVLTSSLSVYYLSINISLCVLSPINHRRYRAFDKLKEKSISIMAAAFQTYIREGQQTPEAISNWYVKYPVMAAMKTDDTIWFGEILNVVGDALRAELGLLGKLTCV